MKSSESNPPVKTKPREAEAGPEEEAFPEELMRLARPPRGITAEVKDGVLTIQRGWWSWWTAGWSWLQSIAIVYVGQVFGMVGLFVGLFSIPHNGLLGGLMISLGLGLFFGLLGGLIGGLFVGLIGGQFVEGSQNAKPTALMAAGDVLQVKYFPLSRTASREIRTDMIHQIFVVASPSLVEENNDHDDKTFKVRARLRSDENVVLFEGLTKPQAKFIEHRLEAFLGIANRRVEGEVGDWLEGQAPPPPQPRIR